MPILIKDKQTGELLRICKGGEPENIETRYLEEFPQGYIWEKVQNGDPRVMRNDPMPINGRRIDHPHERINRLVEILEDYLKVEKGSIKKKLDGR